MKSADYLIGLYRSYWNAVTSLHTCMFVYVIKLGMEIWNVTKRQHIDQRAETAITLIGCYSTHGWYKS